MADQEYYAEDTFGGVQATGRVYTGVRECVLQCVLLEGERAVGWCSLLSYGGTGMALPCVLPSCHPPLNGLGVTPPPPATRTPFPPNTLSLTLTLTHTLSHLRSHTQWHRSLPWPVVRVTAGLLCHVDRRQGG